VSDPRLDGNAAAGLLAEVFGCEMTLAFTVCASCGAHEPVGALLVYDRAPGTVIRCAHCEAVQIRIVVASARYWLDLRGIRSLELRSPMAS
jgi:Family of unknown function (DUF6510)